MENLTNNGWDEIITADGFCATPLSDIMKAVDESAKRSNVYPERNRIFYAFRETPPERVRVVLLGQDPYHEPMQANGLAFSVFNGVKMPPSLRNIFKELSLDLGGEPRTDTDLTDWAQQGVLLLNSALTVVEHNANSMVSLWTDFTDSVIKAVNDFENPVVFVLWGNNARSKKRYITNPRHHIIESAHPSPLSASRGFFGSKPFSKINSYLESDGLTKIKWK